MDGVTYGENEGLRCTYEEAIAATGFGRFHFLLTALCGLAVSSDTIEIICVSYMLPSAACDLNLSSRDKGILNSSLFVGMMVGGLFWGSLADRFGRRSTLLWSLTINGLGGLVSSAAQVFWLLVLLRTISGLGVGGSLPVIYTYLLEFQPKNKRGFIMCTLGTFWMCGNIVVAGLAWIVIPQRIGIMTSGFSYNSWRIFVALCTIPSLISAAALRLMPESPKFLLQRGEEVAALSVMRRVHWHNRPRDNPTFKITSLRFAADEGDDATKEMTNHTLEDGLVKKILSDAQRILQQIRDLFKEPLFWNTIIMLILFFTYCFGYYGVWMWLPEMFNRVEKYGGSPCHLGDVLLNITMTNLSCESPNEWVYISGLMTALSSVPSSLLVIILVDKVGRKSLIVFGMLGTGASVFLIVLVHTRIENLLISCLFGAVSIIPVQTMELLAVELFPTSVRSTGFAVMLAVCRIGAILGNITFGVLMDIHCVIPLLLVAGLFTFGGLCSTRLPNTTQTDVH